VSIISPSVASATSAAPTLVMEEPVPPLTAGDEFAMPSSTTEQNAEVVKTQLLCSFTFILLNVKAFSRIQPENLSQRALHLCKYICF
jgi:hypothetical protein